MKLVVFLATALVAGWGAGSGGLRAEAPADSTGTPTANRPQTRLVIPVRPSKTGSVRIRSVHDNRRLVIIRTRPGAIPAQPVGTPTLGEGLATSNELAQLEARLIDYLDRRLFELSQRAPVSPGAATLAPPSQEVLPGPSLSHTTRSVPVIVAVPPAGEKRAEPAAVVDSVGYQEVGVADTAVAPLTLVPDSAAVPLGLLPDTTGLAATVIEVERAILDTELFRTANVLFESNRSELLPASGRALSAIGIVLRRHPDIRVEIGGHTDTRGADDYNLSLSQLRAETVRSYLIDNFSIDPTRLIAQGYGERQPVADERTPTGRALNRRVEFVVVR
jgi:outer membrane protein OmpA-like peptidoglycan-associated protein